MTEHLFVYGTLREAEVQTHIIGRQIQGEKDILGGYRRLTLAEGARTYPIAVPDSAHQIEGLILALTDEELERTDVYEGAAYRRVRVTLNSQRETWIYRDNPEFERRESILEEEYCD